MRLSAIIVGGMIAGLPVVPAAAATVVASYTGATTADSNALNGIAFGQSFTVVGTGNFNNLTFSFLSMHSSSATGTAVAAGTLALYSAAKSDAPGMLPTDNVDLIARSAGIANGAYVFASDVVLTGGTQYFAYAFGYSSSDPLHAGYVGGNPYSGGTLFTGTSSSNLRSFSASDAGFVVTADAVSSTAPEPATWGSMIFGFGAIGAALRRRKPAGGFA